MASQFEKECLEAHNELRAKHGVPPLKLSSKMSAISQKWADHLNATKTFAHSDNDTMGENIAKKMDSSCTDYKGKAVTEQWYSEIENYDFNTHKSNNGKATGHFTQVVWKGSTELGVGRATDGKGTWVVVANYLPAGNFVGQHNENVFGATNGDNTAPKSSTPPKAASSDIQGGMGKLEITDKSSGDGPQLLGTSTSTKVRTQTSNGVTTKTTITTTIYKYADGSSKTETKEQVETS